MDEQKKDISENIEEKPQKKPRNNIFWIFAGAYLIYTGYQLCIGVINGEEGSNVGFFIAGLVFALVGVWVDIRSFLIINKESKEKRAAEEAEAAQQVENKAKMSISERANLANNLGVVEEEDSDETNAE